jgi:hypothetical protein
MRHQWIWLVLGIWLIISPFILGAGQTVLAYSNVLSGAILTSLFVWQTAGRGQSRGQSYRNKKFLNK